MKEIVSTSEEKKVREKMIIIWAMCVNKWLNSSDMFNVHLIIFTSSHTCCRYDCANDTGVVDKPYHKVVLRSHYLPFSLIECVKEF